MTLLRRLARPLLASVFYPGAYSAFQHPGLRAVKAGPMLDRVRPNLPVDLDPEAMVRVNAVVQLAAATTLSLGRAPRTSAAVLAASLLPTTLAGHPFWQESDPSTRSQSMFHFFKNLSVLGGLLLAVGDTAGQPSLAWRGRHHAHVKKHAVRAGRREAKLA